MLSADQLARYREQGFVVCPGLYPRATCDALTGHLSSVIAGVAAEYLAGARRELGFWDLMKRSRGGLEVFWDPSRGSPREGLRRRPCASATPSTRRTQVSPGSARRRPSATRSARWSVARALLLSSAVIYKQPRSEVVQFGMHQDASYLTTEPESLALAFIALDDMTRENGCLEVLPGSHRAPLGVTLAMGPDGFVPVGGRAPRGPTRDGAIPLVVEKGSVVFVDGRTYHGSEPNRSDGPRRALIVHAMNAGSRLASTSWLVEAGATPTLVPV